MYELDPPSRPSFLRQHGWWLSIILVLDILLVVWWFNRSERTETDAPAADPMAVVETVALPVRDPGLVYVNPTPQDRLEETDNPEVYMPTASGRVESALYGSVRTRKSGSRYLPAFHEGVDIGPMERDRRQRPLDPIFAVADGRVAYVNRVAGNSNYGIYVVLTHDDPVGEIYTLYSHLASVESAIRAGTKVAAGDVLGIMGHTSSSAIPVQRSHLHLEIGVINNRRFDTWYRAQKLKPDHGVFHGHNLTGVDPLAMLLDRDDDGRFSLLDYLLDCPAAFSVAVHLRRIPDYFQRYPDLWLVDAFSGGVVVLEVSEGGVPLRARLAVEVEAEGVSLGKPKVLRVDEDVIGRNGLRLVVQRQGEWQVGKAMTRWLDIFTY